MGELLVTINGVSVYLSLNFSKHKRTAIKEVIDTQTRGMINFNVPEMTVKKIVLEPYNEKDGEFADELVPDLYRFRKQDNRLFFTENKISLSISNDAICYGFNSVFGFSIHFLYFLCAVLSGKTLVHAAAIKVNGSNILIPAFGGIGKTFLISKLSENINNHIYGDDLVLIDNAGLMYPYYRPLCVYKYHYEKYLKNRLNKKIHYLSPSIFWRIILRLRFEILDRLGVKIINTDNITYANGYVTVAVNDIIAQQQIPNGGEKVDKIILIKRKSITKIEKKLATAENKFSIVKYISSVMCHEWTEYSKMVFAYSAFSEFEILSKFWHAWLLVEQIVDTAKEIWNIDIPIDAVDSEIEDAVLSVV